MYGWLETGASAKLPYVNYRDIVLRTDEYGDAVVLANGCSHCDPAAIYVSGNRVGMRVRPGTLTPLRDTTLDVSGNIFCDGELEFATRPGGPGSTTPRTTVSEKGLTCWGPAREMINLESQTGVVTSETALSLSYPFMECGNPVKVGLKLLSQDELGCCWLDMPAGHKDVFSADTYLQVEGIHASTVLMRVACVGPTAQSDRWRVQLCPLIPQRCAYQDSRDVVITVRQMQPTGLSTLGARRGPSPIELDVMVESSHILQDSSWIVLCATRSTETFSKLSEALTQSGKQPLYLALLPTSDNPVPQIVILESIHEQTPNILDSIYYFQVRIYPPRRKSTISISAQSPLTIWILEAAEAANERTHYEIVDVSFATIDDDFYIRLERSRLQSIAPSKETSFPVELIDINQASAYTVVRARQATVNEGGGLLLHIEPSDPLEHLTQTLNGTPQPPLMLTGTFKAKYTLSGVPLVLASVKRVGLYGVEAVVAPGSGCFTNMVEALQHYRNEKIYICADVGGPYTVWQVLKTPSNDGGMLLLSALATDPSAAAASVDTLVEYVTDLINYTSGPAIVACIPYRPIRTTDLASKGGVRFSGRIDVLDEVRVGTVSLKANGGSNWGMTIGDGRVSIGAQRINVAADMVVSGSFTAGTITQVSDSRLKEKVGHVNTRADLEFITKLPLRTYHFKDSRYGTGKKHGIMAQDLQKVAPSIVETRDGFIPNIMTKVRVVSIPSTSCIRVMVTDNARHKKIINMAQPGRCIGIVSTSQQACSHQQPIIPARVMHLWRSRTSKRIYIDLSISMFAPKGSQLTVYGQAADIHVVDKDQLYMRCVGAIQELSRSVHVLSTRIKKVEQGCAA